MKEQVLIENIKDSKVIIRVNYDLPNLHTPERIIDSIKSLKLLLKNNNKILIITHWKRPFQRETGLSIQTMLPLINEIFEENKLGEKVCFVDDVSKLGLSNNKLSILENIRFDTRETSKNLEDQKSLALEISESFDYFVDEAFPLSHRQSATNFEIKNFLPFAFGISHLHEKSKLNELVEMDGEFHVIMGGAKLETKLDLITSIIGFADQIYIGGLLSFTFLEAYGIITNHNLVEKSFLDQAKVLLKKYPEKINLPIDFNLDKDKNPLDIGINTVNHWTDKLSTAKRIFWNGPLGKAEIGEFSRGTSQIASAVLNLDCYTIVGGGDTLASIDEKMIKEFDFISMGGGATLNYLALILNEKDLKQIEVLTKNII